MSGVPSARGEGLPLKRLCPSIRMRVKKLPMILALHLKRFKYMEQLQRYTKLSYRVVFPLELRLFNTSGDATNPDRMYDLVAVVVHCGRWDIEQTDTLNSDTSIYLFFT